MMNADGILKIKEALDYSAKAGEPSEKVRKFLCALAGAIQAEAPEIADRIIDMVSEVEG
jgi:hypothetical protein